MLGRPFLVGAAAVIVGPDDLVEEAVAAEDAVEEHLAVVDFAVVDVEVERAAGGEQAVGLDQARLEEGEEIVEEIGVGLRSRS